MVGRTQVANGWICEVRTPNSDGSILLPTWATTRAWWAMPAREHLLEHFATLWDGSDVCLILKDPSLKLHTNRE
jgi:hypothetical protein